MVRVARVVLGWSLVVIGVAGLVLPFLQGILLIALGLALLARDSPGIRAFLARVRAKWPALDRTLERAHAWRERRRAH